MMGNMQADLSKNISIKQINDEIYCNAVELTPYIDKFQGFYLLKDKLVIYPRTSTRKLTHSFSIPVSGSYIVRVRFINNDGIDDSIYIPITIKIKDRVSETKDVLASKIVVFQKNNSLVIDVLKFIPLILRMLKCELFINNQLIQSSSDNQNSYEFKINQDAIYIIKVTYINLKTESQCIEIEVPCTYKNLLAIDHPPIKSQTTKQSFKLILNILWAFVIREFQRKYDKGYLRYFSIVVGPAIQLSIMTTIFTVMGRKSFFGLSTPVFILTGLLPYHFFTSAGNCLTIITSNRGLLNYKQVKIIDVIIASIIMELFVTLFTFIGGLSVCMYFDLRIIVYNPLSLFCAFSLLLLLTFSFAMILSVVGFYYAEFSYAIQIVFRALFYISGVFFSIESVPVQYQKYFLWNPLLQLIEYIRFSFVRFNLPYELSYLYLIKFTILSFIIGISLYFVNRHKFLINDKARV